MSQNWTFDPLIESGIIIKIDGYTPNITTQDGEFMIVFAVGQHYFSVVIRLDEARGAWKYYPSIEQHNASFAWTNNVYNDIIHGQDEISRWNRVSNGDEWVNVKPGYKNKLEWPLIVKLYNNPINDTFVYQCVLHDVVLETEFEESFAANEEIDVYILNDADDDKPFDIYSIDVEHITYTENEVNIAANITKITSTTILTTTDSIEWSTVSDGSDHVNISSTDDDILEEDDVIIVGSNKDQLEIMIGIVICCVCFSMLIVVCIWYYFTKLEEKEHAYHNRNVIDNINKSEYHQPRLQINKHGIDEVLDEKRRERIKYAQSTHPIVPIHNNEHDSQSYDDEY